MYLVLIQIVLVIVIFFWGFSRILRKIGWSPWWAYLYFTPLIGIFTPPPARVYVLIVLPLVLAAIMLWIVAYIRWPRFEPDPNARETGYDPPKPARFRRAFRREVAPVREKRRAGIVRYRDDDDAEDPPPRRPKPGAKPRR